MADLIYRQAAIDELADMHCKSDEDGYVWIIRSDAWGRIDTLPSAEPEIIRCKDCKHKPYPSDNYDRNNADCGFEIIFPDHRCPCRCDDEYYNYIPDDDWFCGNGE